MRTLYGVPVVVSPLAETLVSGKVLYVKPWMRRRCYPRRVQNKWNARYGRPVFKPECYEARDPVTGRQTFIMHPKLYEQIRSELQ